MVNKDSYFIVEDGILNNLGLGKEYDGGPVRAIKEFLKRNSDYIIDNYYPNIFGENATFNVMGYLKKIK